MKSIVASIAMLICFSSLAHADVVTLKNGDRVEGTLINITGGKIQLKSDKLGALTLSLTDVASYKAVQPVALVIKRQPVVKGTIELLPSGDWRVTTNGQPATFPVAKVDLIMPADAYHKMYEEPTPKPWQAWKGTASLGESLQRGNQDTNTLSTTIAAIRQNPETVNFEPQFRTTFGFTALISQATQTGSSITAHTLTTALREDYRFSPRGFVFGVGQLDHISTSGLYLRQTYGGGAGLDVIRQPNTTFSVLGGITYQREHFIAAPSGSSIDALIGEVFGKQFNKRMRLDHNLNFYPNFSQTGQYRFDTTTTFSLKLLSRLSLNLALIDLYLSNPPAGNQQNNLTFTTGIGYVF